MIGSRWMTRQMPEPTRSREVTVTAAVRRRTGRTCARTGAAAHGRSGGVSPGWPGCGCARGRTATRAPGSSASRATSAGAMPSWVGKIATPVSIRPSLGRPGSPPRHWPSVSARTWPRLPAATGPPGYPPSGSARAVVHPQLRPPLRIATYAAPEFRSKLLWPVCSQVQFVRAHCRIITPPRLDRWVTREIHRSMTLLSVTLSSSGIPATIRLLILSSTTINWGLWAPSPARWPLGEPSQYRTSEPTGPLPPPIPLQ